MKILYAFIAILYLSGCAQLTRSNTEAGGFSTMAAIAKAQFEAEAECYRARNPRMMAVPDGASAVQAVSIAYANAMSLMAARDIQCGGTNVNDVAIARSKNRWGFGKALIKSLAFYGGIKEMADFGTALANAKGTEYNTTMNGITMNNNGGGGGESFSSDGIDGLGDGGGTGTGGSGSFTSSGVSANAINIGGSSAAGGENAQVAESAINGTSNGITDNSDADIKEAVIGGESVDAADLSDNAEGDGNPGFNDPDGENGLDFSL